MQALFDRYNPEDVEERCGFVLTDDEVVQLDNIHPDPTKGFEIDPKETLHYIDRLCGIWHTHPGSASVLSGEDKLCMEYWPDLSHYIVGEDGVREYVVEDGVVIHANHIPR